MDQEGFEVTPTVGIKVFRLFKLYKVTDPRKRIDVLRKFVARHQAVYLRDVKSRIAGKKVLKIHNRESPNG